MSSIIKQTIKALWASAAALAVSATPAFAQEIINLKRGAAGLGNLGELTIGGIISGIIRLLVIVAAVLFFLWLVLGGIKWITSGGDKAKTEEARQQITAALVGLVIVFSAWAIAQLINTLFKVDLFNLQIQEIPTK